MRTKNKNETTVYFYILDFRSGFPKVGETVLLGAILVSWGLGAIISKGGRRFKFLKLTLDILELKMKSTKTSQAFISIFNAF